jgi:hypothetical protein
LRGGRPQPTVEEGITRIRGSGFFISVRCVTTNRFEVHTVHLENMLTLAKPMEFRCESHHEKGVERFPGWWRAGKYRKLEGGAGVRQGRECPICGSEEFLDQALLTLAIGGVPVWALALKQKRGTVSGPERGGVEVVLCAGLEQLLHKELGAIGTAGPAMLTQMEQTHALINQTVFSRHKSRG